jgi:hypothetical protein
MQEEALLLADTFPSPASFKALVQLLSQGSDSSLSEGANKAMIEDYTTIAGLNTLLRVLKKTNESEQVLLAATQQLNLTMKKVLTSGGDPLSLASNFQPFVNALETLAQQQGSEIATQATRTLALLRSSFDIQTVASNEPDGI